MERNNIIDKYTKLIMDSMKAGDKDKSETYKLIKAKMMAFLTQKGTPVLNEKSEIQVLNSMCKERVEAADIYTSGGREDLAEREMKEYNIINELLPKAASEEDIIEAINKYVSENGEFTQKQIGLVIKYVKSMFDNVDGSLVAKIVKSKVQ